MKTSRFQQSYRKSASKLHKKVGDTIQNPSSIFSAFKIYQEYPVSRVNPDYSNASHRFDWVILDLYLVIECHGKQHFNSVTFGGISEEEADSNLLSQKYRDNEKMDAAIDAGFTYITIPYFDLKKINSEYIWELYKKHQNPNQIKKKRKVSTEYEDRQKEKAREYRKEQYQKQKQYLKERRLNNESD